MVTLGEQCPVRSREDHANSCPETSVFGPSHFVHQQRLKIKQLRGKTLVFWASGSRQTGRARAKQCGMVIVLDLPAAMRIHGRLLDRPLTCPRASPCTRRCGASDTLSPWRGQRIKNPAPSHGALYRDRGGRVDTSSRADPGHPSYSFSPCCKTS